MSELTKEYIGKEFGIGDPTKADPDWPRDPEAVCVIETGEYLLPDECAVIMNAMARELLTLRTLRDAGDEEVNWCREELAKTDEELRLIKDLNENHDIAITRGQQLREAQAEIERLTKTHAEILAECYLVEAGGEPGEFTIALKAKILPLIAAAMEEHFIDHPDATNFLTWEINGQRVGKMELTLRKCYGQSPAEKLNALQSQIATLTAERDEARKELAALKSAPGMEEIDAAKRGCIDLLARIVLMRGIEEEARSPQPNPVPSYQELRERIDALADIARRFAVGRDEVAGLLRWLKNKSDRGLSVTYLLDSNNPESARNASRVIEIVEGKNAD